jgi:hypothetical protein
MIAVGVASPIAQGQAMTTTVMKATRAWVGRGSGPRCQPQTEGDGTDDQDDGNEDAADLVGQALDGRLGTLRSPYEFHDLSQRRVTADPSGSEKERTVAVEGAADHLVAGCPFAVGIGSPVSID